MQLRNLNDKCAGLQSKINKKLELLNTYHGYKVFLDDLRDKEVKDREAAFRARKLEEKRQKQNNQQNEMQRRGIRPAMRGAANSLGHHGAGTDEA